MTDNFLAPRTQMVKQQLEGRGIKNPDVLGAFIKVPRHRFVPPNQIAHAYQDCPLPIGDDQTISQPYMVALMSECLGLKRGENVLEIGTGSGYQTAILAELAAKVYSIERIARLADTARRRLDELNYTNIEIRTGDGSVGWPEDKKFEAVIVTAGSPDVPVPLISQLKDGGRLIIPLGGRFDQILTIIRKCGNQTHRENVCGCVFVPLLGKMGWKTEDAG